MPFDVAAYVWPAFTGDEPRTRMFWPENNGEWETVRAAVPQFKGHQWPRYPLWGYQNEADPFVMEMQIEAAVAHGINVFIYDWYWYDNRPFLEPCLKNGFLKARNRSKMKFYIMWANHDVTYGWDRRISEKDIDTLIWQGRVNAGQFRIIGKKWITELFSQPEYYTVDGKPVVSIYDLQNLIDGFGGVENTRREMEWLITEAQKAGFAGVHFQYIKYGIISANLSGFDGGMRDHKPADIVRLLPFASLTHYQFAHFADMGQDYEKIMETVRREWASIEREYTIPFYPHISVGWDNTPRFPSRTGNVVKNNTPEKICAALREAKEYAQKTGVRLITVNSWNEWTECSYLQPDNINGYGYLQAVRRVFCEEEDG